MKKSEFIKKYLSETSFIAQYLDSGTIEKMLDVLLKTKSDWGRLFFLGVGGGAATGSHAANDFNKIAGISTFCLSDNAGLLTALANDEGWQSVFVRQLRMHNLSGKDCVFVYSVNGGTENISNNLVLAIDYAKSIGAKVIGVVGSDMGHTAKKADVCLIVPMLNPDNKTPHAEDFQLIVNHLLSNMMHQIQKGNIDYA
ncbi:MAG: SIS domain-containing protein [Patescibacteria group bacterium]